MGWSDGRSRPRLSLIESCFSAAVARCADDNRSELDPYERSSTRSAVITHGSCAPATAVTRQALKPTSSAVSAASLAASPRM
eukprot:5239578-Prymnesium_polylepis.1